MAKGDIMNENEESKKNQELSLSVRNRINATRTRSIKECIEAGKKLESLKRLFGQFFHYGEITVLCGDTGVGKSLLGIWIAKNISEGNITLKLLECEIDGSPVLYYDFELGDRQFAKRYPDVLFKDHLYRIDMNPECGDFRFSTKMIVDDIKRLGAKFIIIDNISALIMQRTTVDAEEAQKLMRELKELQAKEGLSILILTHTPKIPPYEPLTINHVGGSKAITNFADSVFFIARSRKGAEYRYLKQVKSRNEKELDGVIELKLNTENGVFFDPLELNNEKDHLQERSSDLLKARASAKVLKAEGKSNIEIAHKLSVNKSTIGRWLKE
jgi:predicted ATP-dependent serine protease